MLIDAFQPAGLTTALAVTTSSAAKAMDTPNASEATGHAMIWNAGTGNIAIKFGSSTVTATFPTTSAAGDMIIPASGYAIYTIPPGATHYAAIADSGTATVYVQLGQGV